MMAPPARPCDNQRVSIGLEAAKVITAGVRAAGEEHGLKPLTVVVLDAGGHVVSVEREDGASNNDELAAVSGIKSASLVPQPD